MRPTSFFLALAFAAELVGTGGIATPARAEVIYPWCIVYGGGAGGDGGTNCGFVSRAQCMATASPNIGYCYENPMYQPAQQSPRRSRRSRAPY